MFDDDLPEPVFPELDESPMPPEPPEIYVLGRRLEYSRGKGETGLLKELSDSTIVSSPDKRIHIVSPTGSLSVVGWDRNLIVARSQVEVASGSRSPGK